MNVMKSKKLMNLMKTKKLMKAMNVMKLMKITTKIVGIGSVASLLRINWLEMGSTW